MLTLSRNFLIHREADQSRQFLTLQKLVDYKTSSFANEEVFIYAICNGFR